MEITAAWYDDTDVYLVALEEDGSRSIRKVRASWTIFLEGADESDAQALARLPDVLAVRPDGEGRLRIDCRSRKARWFVTSKLERATDRPDLVREADVNPVRRLLTDAPGVRIADSPRLGYFDLETDSRASFDEMTAGRARVLSWALELPDGRFRIGCLEEDDDDAERRLLRAFFEAARGVDVLLAWNGDRFDFPVLEQRLRVLRLRDVEVRRWSWLDHLEVYRRYHAHGHSSGEEHASFKLGDVGAHYTGEGKDDFDASRTWEAWEAGGEERLRMLRYMVQDTRLLRKIEAATGYVALHLAVCQVCRCLPGSQSLRATEQGDGYLLALGARLGYRWPTKRDIESPDQYEGAIVFEPRETGIIDSVHVVDFAGLYPSIMRSWNMSPETRDSSRGGDTPRSYVPGYAMGGFRVDVRGLVPIALDELVAKRAEYQAEQALATPGSAEWERWKRLSGAFKIVANSFYGIVGSPFFRGFDAVVAESVTKAGRWLLEVTSAEGARRGLVVVYGDTDSVFFRGGEGPVRELVGDLNASWKARLAEHGCDPAACCVKLEFEKSFARMVIVRKKRYAAVLSRYKGKEAEADSVEIKGLEYMRGDVVPIARALQREVIGVLLGSGSEEEAVEVVERHRRRVIEGDLTLDEAVLSQSLKGRPGDYADIYTTKKCAGCALEFPSNREPPKCRKCGTERKVRDKAPHVRVAAVLAARGEEVEEGTRIRYVWARVNGETLPVPADDDGVFEALDREHLWASLVWPATERVLEVCYPSTTWKKTGRPVRRGVADLPLFGAPPVEASPSSGVVVRGMPRNKQATEALRAIALAHPGRSALSFEIAIDPKTIVRVETGIKVELTAHFRHDVGRIGLEVVDDGET